MVKRIDGNKYYEYTRLKNVNVSDTGEKFSLDYNQDELPPDSKEKKDKTLSVQEKKQAVEQNGVKLELSGQGRAVSADINRQRSENAHATAGQPSFLETVQSVLTTLITTIKDFFYKIWNDPDTSTETAASTGMEEVSADTEKTEDVADMDAAVAYRIHEERLQREIQPYLRSGDLNQVISLLTDNGRKTIARNSTLLTYYDRNGRMIEPNASDKERILHGDRNTRKL